MRIFISAQCVRIIGYRIYLSLAHFFSARRICFFEKNRTNTSKSAHNPLEKNDAIKSSHFDDTFFAILLSLITTNISALTC